MILLIMSLPLLTTPDAQNGQGGPLRGMNIRPSGIGVKAMD